MRNKTVNDKRDKSTLIIVVAAIVLLTACSVMILATDSEDAEVIHDYEVTYYPNDEGVKRANGSAAVAVKAHYDGIISTEYNPERWVDGLPKSTPGNLFAKDTGDVTLSNWIGPQYSASATVKITVSGASCTITLPTISDTGKIHSDFAYSFSDSSVVTSTTLATGTHDVTIYFTAHKVFGGWVDLDGNEYLPGDVVPNTLKNKTLNAKWVTPDIFSKRLSVSSNVTLDADDLPHTYYVVKKDSNNRITFDNGSYKDSNTWFKANDSSGNMEEYDLIYGDGRTAPSMYGTIYLFRGTNSSDVDYYTGDSDRTFPSGTYRSDPTIAKMGKFNIGPYNSQGIGRIAGDAIFDTIYLKARDTGKHGGGTNGLYGMGHVLILGTGIITNRADTQVFGGSNGNIGTGNSPMTKTMVFASGNKDVADTTEVYDIATCLIVHSGVYYNLIAGNSNGNIGDASHLRSTYLVLKGGSVMDTVFGGSGAGSGNSRIFGSSESGPFTKTTGGSFVYVTGAFMPADSWIDKNTYYDASTTYEEHAKQLYSGIYSLNDVNVINGGCNKSVLRGTAHVFVTDHAIVYDVTGAGREKTSFTTYSYVEVSGKALVRHAACGGVMNGISEANKQMVDSTHVNIMGDCKIASVYGAGYDIWDKPTYSSMSKGGTIKIEMSGGTVRDIYGGGYRGTIGSDGSPANITINVSGGTVEDSVYGGGSGGVNKFKHNSDGKQSSDPGAGQKNSTGFSFVYGDITVNISGGEIGGSVYGGGKSVPALTNYKGSTFSENNLSNVAQVQGNVHVNVSGGDIKGSVYGAGRGIEWEYDESTKKFSLNEDTSVTKLMTGKGYTYLPWFVGSNNTITWDLSTTMIQKTDIGFAGNYLEFARVVGDTEVTVSGGTVRGSVYGGGANGEVQSAIKSSKVVGGNTYVEITGGRIVENVYGGGLGIEGVVSVQEKRTVFINYAVVDDTENIIEGSVYGSSSIGNDGDVNLENWDEEDYDEYLLSNIPTDSTVIIEKVNMGNELSQNSSVYGGGFMGKTYGDGLVYIGYHYDKVAKSITPYAGAIPKTISLNSIYGGGNITTEEGHVVSPYTQDLVMGHSRVFIYGNGGNGDVTIKGSIFGSGNSCNTRWSTSIEIDSLENKSIIDPQSGEKTTIEGIHRATTLTIAQSSLEISSRNTLTPVAGSPSKDLSIFGIGDMVVKYDTLLSISAPVDYIGNYHSISKDGNPTTLTSPSNKIAYNTGSTIYIRDMVNGFLTYGKVEGYTVLEAAGNNVTGAYVIADQYASGGSGFVIAKEGTYREADFTTSSVDGNNLKCWFLSGTQNKVVTMNMPFNDENLNTVPAVIDILKLQDGTKMRYTGSTLTSVSTDYDGNSFEFVRPGTEEYGYQFGMIVGFSDGSTSGASTLRADTQRYLKIGGDGADRYSEWVSGTYYSDDPNERNGSKEPHRGEESSPARTIVPLAPVDLISDTTSAGTYKLNLLFTGKSHNTTMYVGYMSINLQEITEVAYEATDSEGHLVTFINTMVTNTINIRVDLYVIGTGDVTKESEYKVVLKADDDKAAGSFEGYTEIIIPTGFLMGKLVLEGVSTENISNGQSITISAYKNQDNTTGWMTINSAVVWTKGEANEENPTIGTMSGTVVATIRYSISDFSFPSLEEGQYPKFTLHFKTTVKDGTTVPSDVTVVIQKKPIHIVTYHDSFHDVSGSVRYSDGTHITADSWMSMGSNFIGWYTDPDFINAFDYSTPITKDIDLYARFSFVVTFDFMNGTKTNMYIAADKDGALLNKNRVPTPTSPGYDFKGWYKDTKCIVEWDYIFDSVKEDVTLYAKWVGVEVKVNFLYWDGSGWKQFNGTERPEDVTQEQLISSIMEVGGKYVDMFGNTYSSIDPEPVLATESLFKEIDSTHERAYKYVIKEKHDEHIVDVGKYYVMINGDWVECTDADMLEDMEELRGYCFKNDGSYYKYIDQNTYRIISNNSWLTVEAEISQGMDQFGNEYIFSEGRPILSVMYFYKAEIEYRHTIIGNTYEERVAAGTGWITVDVSTGTYHKDSYGFTYNLCKECTDTIGLYTIWDHTGDNYTVLSCEKVYETVNAVDREYRAERTTEGSMVIWTYYYDTLPYYMEVCEDINAATQKWSYFTYNAEHKWEECKKNNGLFLKVGEDKTYKIVGDKFYHGNVEVVFTYSEDASKYKSVPDSYVMVWIDGVPYFPTVRYGSAFSTEDPQESTSEYPKNILDYAQERVQIIIGDDQFIRWQGFQYNDPSKDKSFPVYSDTTLTMSLINLEDKDWQTGMSMINLYALTAKVAISLIMDKNVQDASAVVAAPSSFLVYPMPTDIILVPDQYFTEPCPYHADDYVEKGTGSHSNEYVMYTDGVLKSDGTMNYYYGVAGNANVYLTEDGKTRLTVDSLYYVLSDENICEYHPEYRVSEDDPNFYYKDTFSNVYRVVPRPGQTEPDRYYEPNPDDIYMMRIYTVNDEGVVYKIDDEGQFYIKTGEDVWQPHDPVTGYYYMDASGKRYVKIDDGHYRMVDWADVVINLVQIGSTEYYEDDAGMKTIWTRSGDVYTIVRCERVFEEGEDENRWAERTISPGGLVTWTYYIGTYGDKTQQYYMERYNVHQDLWMYYTFKDGNWVPCDKDNDLYLKDNGGNEYIKHDDSKFGEREWKIVLTDINESTHKDQFGNYYGDGTPGDKPYRIVYLFENEFYSLKVGSSPGAGEASNDWITYDKVSDAPKYLEHTESLTPGSDEKSKQLITMRLRQGDHWAGWNGSEYVDAPGVYREYYRVFKDGQSLVEQREFQIYIPAGPDQGWKSVYWEEFDGVKWTYRSAAGDLDKPIAQFYFKDLYSNHYSSYDWANYTCIEGSDTYYKFDFKLNEASRNGYKLIGWHNDHVNTDDAKYPTSGIYRTLKLFFHDDGEHTVISKEVLETKSDTGENVEYVTINYDQYESESSEYSYHTFQGKDLPRIDNPAKMYNVRYLALWAQMDYTVSVSEIPHGRINAFLVENDGSRTLISGGSATVHYGDRIELTYTSSGNYQFSKWMVTGEYEIEDETSTSTTLVVHGNCSISVSDIGERIVTLPIRFDAGILSDEDRAKVSVELRNTATNESILMQNVDHTNAEVFRQYVPLNSGDPNEAYEVYVRYLYQDAANEEEKVYERYLLKGTFRVERDNDITIEYDIISARIMQYIDVYDEGVPVRYWTKVDDVELETDSRPTKLTDKDGNVVAEVTRYVGVITSYLQGHSEGYIINNPYNEVPAVQITIKQGFDYLTFEGFPDYDEQGHETFNLNRDWNYHAGYSFADSVLTFDLNWTRTDKPADILVQLKTSDAHSYTIDYVAKNGETTYEYTGSEVDYMDDVASQLVAAIADLNTKVPAGKMIQGLYFDKNYSNPIQIFVGEEIPLDAYFISKLEENKEESGYHIYAKVISKSNQYTQGITVVIKEEGKADRSATFNLEEKTSEVGKQHGFDIMGEDHKFSSSVIVSQRYDRYLSGDRYDSSTSKGTAYLYGYNGITFTQTLRDGLNSNIEITGKTINNTFSSHGITEWSAIKGYGFFDINLKDLDISPEQYIWVYEKSTALSLLPSTTAWANPVALEAYTESIRSYQFSNLDEDTFGNDLHFLIPQDGTDITIILYVSGTSASGTFSTDKAYMNDHPGSFETLVSYKMKTTSLNTEINLEGFAIGGGHHPTGTINNVYADWAYDHSTESEKVLSGTAPKNVRYAGINITLGEGFNEEIAKKHGLTIKEGNKYSTPKMVTERANHKLTSDGSYFETDKGTVSFYMYNGMVISQKTKDGKDFVMEAVGEGVNNVMGNKPVTEWTKLDGYGFFDISLSGLDIPAGKYIWVYEKSSALSALPEGTAWAHAVSNEVFTESIKSYQFSTLNVNHYNNDLHILMPQDGTDIVIVLYICDEAASGTFATDIAAMEAHPENFEKIVGYMIKTNQLATEINLETLGPYSTTPHMNPIYLDWGYSGYNSTKTMAGNYKILSMFVGQNIIIPATVYGGTFLLDVPEGYHIVDNGVSPYLTFTGSVDHVWNMLQINYIEDTPVSITIDLINPAATTINIVIEYKKNTVIFHIDKSTRDTNPDETWFNDSKEFKYGDVVSFPDVTRDGQHATGWTSSPIIEITKPEDVFKHTVNAKDSGTIVITPHYDPEQFWTVTFITPMGTYPNGQHSYSLDVIKDGYLTVADIPVPDITGIEGYKYIDESATLVTIQITKDMQFSSKFESTNHDLAFRADVPDHCEVSATNDSSDDLLITDSHNDLQHHSEISVIIKPTKGRTIAINETRDSAYKRVESGTPKSPTITSNYDEFKNYYSDGSHLTYSIVWMYGGTLVNDATKGYYTQYKIDASSGLFYVNTGETITYDPADTDWKLCDPVKHYVFLEGEQSTSTHVGNKFLLDNTNEYKRTDDGKYQKVNWTKYTDVGYPEQLSNDRGFLWTFFLDADVDMTFHTTVVSININFVVNGESIDDNEHYMKVWGTGDKSDKYYLLGNNIPMYDKVVFYGYENSNVSTKTFNDNLRWYRDRSCTDEYPSTMVEISPGVYHRQYSYLATEDLTLYTNAGRVTTYLNDHNGENIRGYLLQRDGENKITLGGDTGPRLEGYLFAGWGTKDNNDHNVFQYAPNSTFEYNEDKLYLYAYYLEGGVDTSIAYDGLEHTGSISLCTSTGEGSLTQDVSKVTLVVEYTEEGGYKAHSDVGKWVIDYTGILQNNSTHMQSVISGSMTLEITKVEIYVIAPSASFVYEKDSSGKSVVHYLSSDAIQVIAATPDGSIPNPSDIAGIVLDTEMPGYTDHASEIGSYRTAGLIMFVEGKADDYIVHYVDGAIVIYPEKTGRYMNGGA